MSEPMPDITPDPEIDDPTDDTPIAPSPYDDNGMHTGTDPATGTAQDDNQAADPEA